MNRIRGLKPWPGAFTFIKDKILKIISAEEYLCGDGDMDSPSGSIIVTDEKTGLVVRSKDGALLIKELQLEGRKRMASKLFLRGNKISRGLKLG